MMYETRILFAQRQLAAFIHRVYGNRLSLADDDFPATKTNSPKNSRTSRG